MHSARARAEPATHPPPLACNSPALHAYVSLAARRRRAILSLPPARRPAPNTFGVEALLLRTCCRGSPPAAPAAKPRRKDNCAWRRSTRRLDSRPWWSMRAEPGARNVPLCDGAARSRSRASRARALSAAASGSETRRPRRQHRVPASLGWRGRRRRRAARVCACPTATGAKSRRGGCAQGRRPSAGCPSA